MKLLTEHEIDDEIKLFHRYFFFWIRISSLIFDGLSMDRKFFIELLIGKLMWLIIHGFLMNVPLEKI